MAQKFCSNCGAPIEPNARFCGQCGTPVEAEAKPQRPMPTFLYPNTKRQSKIITNDVSGVPVVEFRQLHPNTTLLFFFAFVGRTFILIPLFAITAFVEPMVAAIMGVSYIIILLLIARLLYKNFRFEITENAFHKEYGVFHKRNVSVPIEQVQNVNVRFSVLDQILGLAHVEIETAGDSGTNRKGSIGGLYSSAEGYIPGVSPSEARDIRDLLLARMQQID